MAIRGFRGVRRWLIIILVAVVLAGVATVWVRRDPMAQAPPGPFGIFLDTKDADIAARVAQAQRFEVRYFRSTAVQLPAWNGLCSECTAVHRGGLQWVLTVRNSPNVTSAAGPVDDVAALQETVGKVLDKVKPNVVVVENEENAAKFFTGTPEEYARELQAVCGVAHARHRLCTNGGILSGTVAWLVYVHYLDTGQRALAASFAERALPATSVAALSRPGGDRDGRARAALARRFIEQYRSAGADYLNIHWYIADGHALEEAVTYLRTHTGLEVMSNEMGQRNLDPAVTTSLLTTAQRIGMPIVVWFSVDARLARSLLNPDGSLRSTGDAFGTYVAAHHT